MPRPLPAASAPALPILSKAALPTDQLNQIQRRLAHLLNSLAELQGHVSTAQTLEEWPSLLSRHLALASQTNSLASFLALANPNAYNSQLSNFNESLTTEALQNNKFSVQATESGIGTNFLQSNANDILFSGSKDENKGQEESTKSRLVQVQYTDEKNPLRRLAPHPFFPLESERGQLVLPPLLLPKPDEHVIGEEERRWKNWATKNQIPEKKSILQNVNNEEEENWIHLIRDQIREHDEFAGQAIRSFVHAREATDDLGQRYDWKMRLDPEELSEDEEIDEVEEEEENEDSEKSKKRKRAEEGEQIEEEATWSLEQVGAFLSTGELF